ncbi:MAG: hypothetical protein Ct9H300mP28_00100 [Pseudomonadota bacterium]|nr:MAG: hypothetical protein Ct9H300mP28_00100 [Pseudomonadota bacterium]
MESNGRTGLGIEKFLDFRRTYFWHNSSRRVRKALGEWIIEGSPSIDMMGVDPRRFSAEQSTRDFIKAKRGVLRTRIYNTL